MSWQVARCPCPSAMFVRSVNQVLSAAHLVGVPPCSVVSSISGLIYDETNWD